jgi:hypothetical protein
MSRKNRSTMLSHEALVGVKCMVIRGCLASHAWRVSRILCKRRLS